MLIKTPVYADEYGAPKVSVYKQSEDGTFRKTVSEPFRALGDNIAGIGLARGELLSPMYDRQPRQWHTPTILCDNCRPMSFYHFIRTQLASNKFFVCAKPIYGGQIRKFTIHELKLKNSVSQRKITMFKDKLAEAIDLWAIESHQGENHYSTNHKPL